jgi:amino acid transporter
VIGHGGRGSGYPQLMSLSHGPENAAHRAEDAAQDRADEHAEERADQRADERAHEGAAEAGASSYGGRVAELGLDRTSVLQRERERYGGVKLGAAFFGWLTATGTGVLLTALLAGAGAAVGVATNPQAGASVQQATVGLVGGIALLCILFIAYYCGGYVAGRMARFNGVSQGVAVWIIAVVIAVGVAVLGAIAGRQYDVLGTLNSFPRIPVGEGTLAGAGIAAALLAAVVSLVGAVLGGMAGMRYHRKVDRAGLGV